MSSLNQDSDHDVLFVKRLKAAWTRKQFIKAIL